METLHLNSKAHQLEPLFEEHNSLWNISDLYGYTVRAKDGETGKVHDFYFDDKIWAIRYLVVDLGDWVLDTGQWISGQVEGFIIDTKTWMIASIVVHTNNWWPAKKVLVETLWIDRIELINSTVFVDLPRNLIKASPEFKRKAFSKPPTSSWQIKHNL